jgi:hypothetical protein
MFKEKISVLVLGVVMIDLCAATLPSLEDAGEPQGKRVHRFMEPPHKGLVRIGREQRRDLDEQAQVLAQHMFNNPGDRVVVKSCCSCGETPGKCRALGLRYAESAIVRLTAAGIDRQQISMASYGRHGAGRCEEDEGCECCGSVTFSIILGASIIQSRFDPRSITKSVIFFDPDCCDLRRDSEMVLRLIVEQFKGYKGPRLYVGSGNDISEYGGDPEAQAMLRDQRAGSVYAFLERLGMPAKKDPKWPLSHGLARFYTQTPPGVGSNPQEIARNRYAKFEAL